MSSAGHRHMRRDVPAKPLALAMVAVVISFASSLLLSHYAARSIDVEVTGIVANAAPSIKSLASARADLRRMATYPPQFLLGSGQASSGAAVGIAEACASFERHWAAYD